MWIQVRSMTGNKCTRIDGLSKLTRIEDLRLKLVTEFDAPPEKQRLFYRGKQLEDGHTLFDYDVGLNHIIQIMIRAAPTSVSQDEQEQPTEEESKDEATSSIKKTEGTDCEGSTFKLGDIIDARDDESGGWFEAELTQITKNKEPVSMESDQTESTETSKTEKNEDKEDEDKENITDNIADAEKKDSGDAKPESAVKYTLPDGFVKDDGFLYYVRFEGFDEPEVNPYKVSEVRPRARHKVPLEKINVEDRVMLNYNYDEPLERGYWYDAVITSKKCTRTIKDVTATVFVGKDLVPMENCRIAFWWDIFKLEKPGTQLNKLSGEPDVKSPEKRASKVNCDWCKDKASKKCKHCSCRKCGGKESLDKQIMCDECDGCFHLWCLEPPLTEVPTSEEWFCPECKNDSSEIVGAGQKLKGSKKKAKMASGQNKDTTRDWGKGMACVGRSKMCNSVPPNHFGTIPGVEVGSLWKFRVQVSEAGIHRPHVAGIHGREDEGAYSIVLSGGYEDDEDHGDYFTYTGSGGRDLSGNKRTAEQSCDQQLTRMNRALAKNCYVSINNKDGAEATDWKKGKPCRVVRNCKGRKHSDYAPEEGNRYDGIYKIAKYWPSKGKSGFLVWRYELRRDDPTPAPWTKEGKKRTEELGLTMQYPEGYLESQKEKEKEKEEKEKEKKEKGKGKGKNKRKRIESDDEGEDQESPASPVVKKKKPAEYKVSSEVSDQIKEDSVNSKLWEDALSHTKEGGQVFVAKVEELFSCLCCQDIVFKPVTTSCSHNICKTCLQRSFKAEVYSCPACRTELGKDYKMTQNTTLTKILNTLFPGYENGR